MCPILYLQSLKFRANSTPFLDRSMELVTNIDKSTYTDICTINHIHFLVFRTTESMTPPSMTRMSTLSFFLFTVHDLPLYTLSSKINEDRTIVVEKKDHKYKMVQ